MVALRGDFGQRDDVALADWRQTRPGHHVLWRTAKGDARVPIVKGFFTHYMLACPCARLPLIYICAGTLGKESDGEKHDICAGAETSCDETAAAIVEMQLREGRVDGTGRYCLIRY